MDIGPDVSIEDDPNHLHGVDALLRRTHVISHGWGTATDRRQVVRQVMARGCQQTLGALGDTMPILCPGSDVADAARPDGQAIAAGQRVVLTTGTRAATAASDLPPPQRLLGAATLEAGGRFPIMRDGRRLPPRRHPTVQLDARAGHGGRLRGRVTGGP